jgi:tetratricopeptide (TPR) repeat protein
MNTTVSTRLILALLPLAFLACRPDPAVTSARPGASATSPSSPRPAPAADTRQSNFAPDPNETSEDFRDRYHRARQLMGSGDRPAAESALQEALERYPDSRHLHQLYAELLWDRSENGKDRALLRQAADHAVRAAELGLQQGFVDARVADQVSNDLGLLGDREALDRVFQRLLARDPSSAVYLSYGRALGHLGDPRAEGMLRKAVEAERDSSEAMTAYAEWLLDHGRDAEVLTLVPESAGSYYLHFLRGVALERTKRPEEAQKEYARFAKYSQTFPAPQRYRVPDSRIQAAAGIRFTAEEGGRVGRSRRP